MGVLGIGVDIVEIERFAAAMERSGQALVNRLFLPGEQAYCATQREPALCYAARFAAKEAVSKAFGTGIGAQLGWQDIEIRRKESGEPFVVLHGKGAELFAARGARQLHLSLTHTENYAAATAILEAE